MLNKTSCLAVLLSLGLLACATVPVKVFPEGSITCANKQDRKLDFTYLPENALAWHSIDFSVNVYLIDTIDSGQIAINSLELENYTCNTNGA